MKLILGPLLFVSLGLLGQQVDYVRQTTNKPTLDPRAFTFSISAIGNLASTGAKSVTLTPCPPGISGANTSHYIYISGGTGTAEAVLITGGTCTSGATTGTLTFTTANTHTGAWKLSSATVGIQEAAYALGANGGQISVSGVFNYLYAGIYIPYSNTNITGAGIRSTTLNFYTANGTNWITLAGGNSGFNLHQIALCGQASSGCYVDTPATQVGGTAIVSNISTFVNISDVMIHGAPNGLNFTDATIAKLDEISIRSLQSVTGHGIDITGNNTNAVYINRAVIHGNTGTEAACGICIGSAAEVYVTNSMVYESGWGMAVLPDGGSAVVALLTVDNVSLDHNKTGGLIVSPTNGASVTRSKFSNVWSASSSTGPGMVFSKGTGANLFDITVENATIFSNSEHGIAMDGVAHGKVVNSSISHNGIDGVNNNGIILISGGPYIIDGNFIGKSSETTAETQATGITVGASVIDVAISANNFKDNTYASIVNSSASTVVIAGNVGATNNSTVSSVFARTGAIIPQAGDYSAYYSALGHNHSGVYEPVDANILRSGDPTKTGTVDLLPGTTANFETAVPTGLRRLFFDSAVSNHLTAITDAGVKTDLQVPATASALVANGSNCSAGSFPLGVDASGVSESCTAANSITVVKAQTPLTTKGDLWVTDGTAMNRLAVGTDGQVLTSDAVSTNGVKWASAGGGGSAIGTYYHNQHGYFNVAAKDTQYWASPTSGAPGTATESQLQLRVPVSGTIGNVTANMIAASGANCEAFITVRKNSAATSATLIVAAGETGQRVGSTTDTVVAGDLLSVGVLVRDVGGTCGASTGFTIYSLGFRYY